jgi:hypothetical protein
MNWCIYIYRQLTHNGFGSKSFNDLHVAKLNYKCICVYRCVAI